MATNDNYVEMLVGLQTDKQWFRDLQGTMKKLRVSCKKHFHITALFLKNDTHKDKLKAALDKKLGYQHAPRLTFDKLDAFTRRSGDQHIVCLTSTQPEPEFARLIDDLHDTAVELGASPDDFRLHVTLARVPANRISLAELQKLLSEIPFRPFTLDLTEVEYRYLNGGVISKWHLPKANNDKSNTDMWDYRKINYEVMTDTKFQYETVPKLKETVKSSIEHQYMVAHETTIDLPELEKTPTKYLCSAKRSFEAAKAYKGKKTSVLNFANSHAIGGRPFSAGAQEESLCRCSTLLPCLEAMREDFYQKHQRQYTAGEIGFMGNDDLIYTPDVVVFKTDESTDPVYPKMMAQSEWYKVNVITCAAPELMNMRHRPANYEEIIVSRIKKILDVAAKENNEVLILGAWGCGAFKNDPIVVANAFHSLLGHYNFEIVEFALSSRGALDSSPFAKG